MRSLVHFTSPFGYCRDSANLQLQAERNTKSKNFITKFVTLPGKLLIARLLLIVTLVFQSLLVSAEGTRQLEPIVGPGTQYCKLYFDNDLTQFRVPFAQLGCSSDYRLYFFIDNPGTEVVYFGFGSAINYGNAVLNDLQFQIKDPNNNVVPGFAMTALPTAGAGYIATNPQAQAGPNIGGTVPAGYTPLSFTPTIAGNYYIEFSKNNLPIDIDGRALRYFDLTVASGTTPIDGRLWSKAWQMSSSTTSAAAGGKSYASFYSFTTDSIVTRFNCNGFAGGVFTVYCNQYGTANTGTWNIDRRSIMGNGTVIPQYKLFLNDPDTNVYKSGVLGRICDVVSQPYCDGTTDILVKVTRPGTMTVIIDVLPAGTGPEDVTITQPVIGNDSCNVWDTIHWNGINGLGGIVQNGAVYNMNITYLNGLTNLPLYDVEDNRFGIKVDLIRPSISGPSILPIYWDDINVGGSTNLTGCMYPTGGTVTGCHPWRYTGSQDTLTHNSWWYYLKNGPAGLMVAIHRTPPAAPVPSGPSQVCQGQTSVTYSIPAQLSTDRYIWYLPDGTVDTTLVPSVTFDIDSTATSGTIAVVLYNANCGSGTASAPLNITVTVTPVPSPLIIRPCPFKTGDLTSVQPAAQPGTTLTWYTSATSPSPATLVPSPTSAPAGVYYLFAINNTTGCFSPASLAVHILCDTCAPIAVNDTIYTSNTTPGIINVILNDQPGDFIINPATVDLNPALAGLQQTLTLPGIGTLSVNASGVLTFIPNVAFIGTVSVPYTIMDMLSNLSNQANIVITVGPDGVAVPAYQIICSGDTAIIHLSSSVPGATFTWTVTGPASVSGQAPGSGNLISQVLVNSSMANHIITYWITPWYGGIAGPVVSAQVEVTPPVTLTNPSLASIICSGSNTNITLTTSPVAATVNWNATNTGNVSGIIPTSGTSKNINQTLVNNDPSINFVYYDIQVSNYGCTTDPYTYTVTVNPVPDVFVFPATTVICSGTTINLSLASSIPSTTFSWTATGTAGVSGFSAGSGSSIAQTISTVSTTQGTVTYIITPLANGCSGNPYTYTVTVNPIPAVTNFPLSAVICSGSSTSISLTSSVGGSSYSWLASGTSGTSGYSSGSGNVISQVLNNSGNTPGTVTYSITPAANGCFGSTVNYAVTVNPQVYITSGPLFQSVCSGFSTWIPLTSNVTGSTFSWSASGDPGVSGYGAGSGSVINQTLVNVNSTPGNVTYAITPTANGCAGVSSNYVVTVNPDPVLFTMAPTGPQCAGTILRLNGSENGLLYILRLNGSNIDTITGTGLVGFLDFGPQYATGTYDIIAMNPVTGCQAPMLGTVLMNPNPGIFSVIPAGILCPGANIGLTGSETGISYQLRWNHMINIGVPVNGTGGPISFGTQIFPGTYTVIATNPATGCYALMADSATIYPQPTIYSVVPAGSGCPGTSIGLTSSQLLIDYVLLLNGIIHIDTIPGSGNPIDFGPQTTAGTYTILAISQSNYCQTLMNGTFVINPEPFRYNLTPSGTLCVGQSISLSGSETGVTYQLYNGTMPIGAPVAGTGNVLNFGPQWLAGVYTVIATSNNFGCTAIMNDSTVYQPLPSSYAIYPQGIICLGSPISLNGSDPGINYTLMLNGVIPVDTLAGTGGVLDFGIQTLAGTYTVMASATTFSCQSTMTGSAVMVTNPLVFNVTPAGTNCGTANLGLDGSETGVNYTLYYNGMVTSSIVSGTGSPVSFGTQYPGNYTVLAVNTFTGCQSTMNGMITINELPVAAAGADATICENGTASLSGSAFMYTSVQWTTSGDGTFVNPGSLYAGYVPGSNDNILGHVTLTLTAYNTLCGSASDDLLLTIIPYPVVDAGPDAVVCDACNYQITNSAASNTTSVYWITSGTGTFSNSTDLHPFYYPSTTDYALGSVVLTLTGNGISPCGEDNDHMILSFDPNPGVDFTWGASCEHESVDFFVDPVATNTGAIASWYWDFGDGGSSLLMNPAHIFPGWGPYNVRLTAIDTTGYVRIVQHEVYVSQPPAALFATSDPNCSNEEVQFKDLSHTLYGYIEQWVWHYNDGLPNDTINFPDDPNVRHLFDTSGVFNVVLTIRNSFGCENSIIMPVTVIPAPVANFYYNGECDSTVVNFFDASYANGAGNVVQWWWNFDDPISGINNTSELENPTHTFSKPGTYMVTHVVRNFNNCTDTIVKPVIILPPQDVQFTHTYTCIDELTHFIPDTTSINAGAVATWLWDFGDGLTSNEMFASHAYTLPGTYQVTLTITDTSDCVDYGSQLLVVNPEPVANFSTEPWLCEDSPVQFTDQSLAVAGYIHRWEWIFGDGDTLVVNHPDNPNVEHIYDAAGTYFVTLKITVTDSCTAEVTNSITINPAPVANFAFDHNCQDNLTQFNDLSQLAGGGNVTAWAWNFGDPASGIANTSTLQNPLHEYAATGTYNVSLTVTTANGCSDEVIIPVTIVPAPAAEFTFQQNCAGTATLFTPAATIPVAGIDTWFWDFGDGSTSSLQQPAHQYATIGNYQVTFTITDTAGCSNSITHTVTIVPSPVSNFTSSQPSCSGNAITFNSLASVQVGYIVEWTWDFGDGTSQTITIPENPNITHTYATYGQFPVTLTVVTNDSCSASRTIPVNVLQSPLANFSFDGSCVADPVHFNDLSQGGTITSWNWNFGDIYAGGSNSSMLQNPQHTYSMPGTYPVKLITGNVNGCFDTIVKSVVISPAPAVDFTFNAGCANDTVHFVSSASVNMTTTVSWLWQFGDGNTSTDSDPFHVYAMPGFYNVSLTINDTSGCDNTKTRIVPVTQAPVAAFATSSLSCSGMPVAFNDMSTTSNGSISSWHWNFDDGTDTTIYAPANPDIEHVFAVAGTYNVTLSITTTAGCEDDVTLAVTVNFAPVAAFEVQGSCPGQPAMFTDQSQASGGSTIVSWSWNFGDPASGSNTSYMQNPQHIYSQPGTYTVTLQVENMNGCTANISQNITVTPPTAVAIASGIPVCFGTPVILGIDSAITNPADIASYDWDFGDGTPHSSLANPSHTYNAPGNYTIILTITDLNGCNNTDDQPITVHTSPVAQFSSVNSCVNLYTSFTDQSFVPDGDPIVSWSWDFGVGGSANDTSSLQNPVWMYATGGTYQVSLEVTTLGGCTGSVTSTVTILPKPEAGFAYIAEPCHHGSVSFSDSSYSQQSVITSWYWEFEPGSYSTLRNPTYVFLNTDTWYNVKLTVTNAQGCTDTIIKPVYVPSGLSMTFTAAETCFGDTTQFSPQLLPPVTDSIAFYSWNFGDPNTGIYNLSTLRYPAHRFSKAGTYVVTLTATTPSLCTTTIYRQVEIVGLPKPKFSYTGGDCTDMVELKDLTSGTNLTQWIWEFGDGNTVTINAPANPNVSHSYPNAGLYMTSLTVTNAHGCVSSVTDSVKRLPCIASNFNINDTTACQNRTMHFSDMSTCAGPIANWMWDFGDGTTQAYTSPQDLVEHTFTSAGTYTVRLVVNTQLVGGVAAADTSAKAVWVHPAPRAQFVWNDVCLSTSSEFKNTTNQNGLQVRDYSWDFGDFASVHDTSSALDPSYLYTEAGGYDVKMVAGNTMGCTDTIVHTVNVFDSPKAEFNWQSSCDGDPVQFVDKSDTASAPLKSWNWYFHDDAGAVIGAATSQNPAFDFANPGLFYTELSVTDKHGCENKTGKQVAVNSSPVAAFTIKDNYGDTQGQIQIQNGTINGSNYLWDFGDGKTSYAESPVTTYDKGGSYTIRLITWNGQNCADTAEIKYELTFKGLYIPNAFSPDDPQESVRLFKPVGMNLRDYHIEVLDRWGNVIWSSEKLDKNGTPVEGWDGTLNSVPVQSGVYMWRASATFTDGTKWDGVNVGDNTILPQTDTGTVTLIR